MFGLMRSSRYRRASYSGSLKPRLLTPEKEEELRRHDRRTSWILAVLVVLFIVGIGPLICNMKPSVCLRREPGVCHHGPPVSYDYPCDKCVE